MLTLRKYCGLVVLAALFPTAALADLSGTVTLPVNNSLNLDTGATAGSGGDLFWNGSTLTPLGSAKAVNISTLTLPGYTGISGSAGYAEVTQTALQQGFQLGLGSSAPIGSLVVNTVLGASTNGGNFAKLLVTAVSAASITFQYTTYVTVIGVGAPTIATVQNNYSYLLPDAPNYGIAPGALFIITGTNLANTTVAVLQSSAPPGIPLALNGASLSVTVNGVTTQPGIYYAISTQIAAVLPSSTPVGTGTITVTYNGVASKPASITVVPSAMGFDTYYQTGVGLGVATDFSYNVFNYTNSAQPGQNIILWGSGLGANTADSDTVFTSTPHAVKVPLTIYIGGIQATIIYAGGSGYPGLNQIDVTIPASVSTGCNVSVAAVSGGIVSNIFTLPINAGGGVCSDPLLGINGTMLSNLLSQSTVNVGYVAITTNQEASDANALFVRLLGNFQGLWDYLETPLTSAGSCVLLPSQVAVAAVAFLDAGTMTITGPLGTSQLATVANPSVNSESYHLQMSASFFPATGGSFTFSGSGGQTSGLSLGAFTSTISYSNPLNWTNKATSSYITRSQGLTITWTGGAPNSLVGVQGSWTSADGNDSANFFCNALASAGEFTIPPYVLMAMPAGNGSLGVGNGTVQTVSIPGLDFGIMLAGMSYSINAVYQ